jgi:hypothetical protein
MRRPVDQRIPLVRGARARGKLRKRVARPDAYWYLRITLVRGYESPRAARAGAVPPGRRNLILRFVELLI